MIHRKIALIWSALGTPQFVMYIQGVYNGERMGKKARIQIYIDEEQDRLLERLARLKRTSKSRLIRESIERYLEELVPLERDPALGIVGLAGKVGKEDLSERHDAYLMEFCLGKED